MRISKPSYQESSTPNEFVVVLLGDDDKDSGPGPGQGTGRGQGVGPVSAPGQELDGQGQWLDAVLDPVTDGIEPLDGEKVGMEE